VEVKVDLNKCVSDRAIWNTILTSRLCIIEVTTFDF